MARALKVGKDGKLRLSEAQVLEQIEDFLRARGWRIFVTGYGEIVKNGRPVAVVGEKGMPDRLCIRYGTGSYAEVIWLEGKRPKSMGDSGGKLRDDQRDWIRDETVRGASCFVPNGLDGFLDWYRQTIGER